jgi:Zn-dependent protease with chaperone function
MVNPLASTRPAAPDRPRPDVLAYPSPTTSRYLVFLTALLAAGLFVGNWFHLQLLGDDWTETVAGCLQQPGGATTLEGMLESQRAETACTADAERVRTLFAVGGAAFAALAAAVVLYVSPRLVRRRRGLRELGPALSGAVGRIEDLAHEAGVEAPVRPLIGSSKLRDAFSFGAPGNYYLALPPGLAVHWRNPALFDPAVRHELAHAAHRDIALAWLTRSVWWALVPVLALPILFGVLSGDLSVVPSYTWRAVTLGVVVALLSAALLRSREYGADLRAARWSGDRRGVEKVVGGARPVPGPGLKGLLANHPTPQERLQVLADPAHLARAGFVDGLTGAFLAALALPLIVSGLSPALTASGRTLMPYLLASLALGPMLGASVGLGLWRAALVARVSGGSASAGAVAAGVGLGLVLGQAASLDAAGLGDWLGIRSPGWLLVTGVLGAGATVLAAGLGHVWADVAPRMPGIRSCWVLALMVNAAIFSALLWSVSLFQSLVQSGGWLAGRTAMIGPLAAWPMFWLVVAVGAVALLGLALRSDPTAPGWLLEDAAAAAWPPTARRRAAAAVLSGLVAGATAAAVIVVYRLSQGPATDDAANLDRVLAYQWVIALGVAAAATVLVVRDPVRGGAAALAAGPVAAVTGTVGFLVLNVALGGRALQNVAGEMVRPSVVIGFYLTLAVASAAYAVGQLVDRRAPAHDEARLGAGVLAAALVLTGAAGALALQQPEHLVGVKNERLLANANDALAAADYVANRGPELGAAYGELASTAVTIDTDPTLTPNQRAALLVTEVAEPVRALADEWSDLPGAKAELLEVHEAALRALAVAEEKYLTFAEGYRLQDPALFDRGRGLQAEEDHWWRTWNERAERLLNDLG